MKSLSLLALLASAVGLFALSGCMSGTVTVSDANSAPDTTPSGSTPSTVHESQNAGSDASNAQVDPATATTVYFALSNPMIQMSTPGDALSGLGFLSTESQVATPFWFSFPEQNAPIADILYWKPVQVGDVEEVAWIEKTEQTDSGNTLVILDPSSMEIQTQMSVPAAQNYALFGNASDTEGRISPEVAGIDSNGALFVIGSSKKVQLGKSGFSQGSQIRWVGGPHRLAITDPATKTVSILSTALLTAVTTTIPAQTFSASPSGKLYLVLTPTGQLNLMDTSTAKTTTLPTTIDSFDQDRWNGESEVAFVDTSSAGSQVDVLSLPSGQITAKFSLSLPQTGLGVAAVCPAWVGGGLYFSNADVQGASIIWKADAASSIASPFATPQSSQDSGNSSMQFECPKGVSE